MLGCLSGVLKLYGDGCMNSFFAEPLSKKKILLRKERLNSALDIVLEKRKWDRSRINEFQLESLREIVAYAYEHIPFYRRKYDEYGFQPSMVKELDDIKRIPWLTKSELRKLKKEEMLSPVFNQDKRFLTTSGSTGTPVGLYKSETSIWHFTAYAMTLYYQWCCGKPIKKVMYLLDSTPHNIDYALADQLRTIVMEERIVSTFEKSAEIMEKFDEFEPEYLSSYPATMRNLAAYLADRNQKRGNLKLLHLTSEMLDERTRKLLKKVFPYARIVETYTTTEAGMLGFECEKEGGFHLAEDSAIYELIDADNELAINRGRLVVTDLTNWATPVIRYSGLGDLVEFDGKSRCECGSVLKRIKNLEGRYVDSILLKDGTALSPYTVTNIIADIPDVLKYQIIQHEVDDFQILIVLDDKNTAKKERIRETICEGFKKLLAYPADCRVEFANDIKSHKPGHKIPLVVSRVIRF